jgi:molybdate transport system regulatory protein
MFSGNRYSLSSRKRKLQYTFRLYLNNAAGMRLLGKGGAEILKAINRYGSMAAAARHLGMSYKFVWGYLIRMQKRLNQPVVITHRGGADRGKRKGGGGTILTPVASNLLREFESTQRLIENTLSNKNKMLKLQNVASRHGNLARAARKH